MSNKLQWVQSGESFCTIVPGSNPPLKIGTRFIQDQKAWLIGLDVVGNFFLLPTSFKSKEDAIEFVENNWKNHQKGANAYLN